MQSQTQEVVVETIFPYFQLDLQFIASPWKALGFRWPTRKTTQLYRCLVLRCPSQISLLALPIPKHEILWLQIQGHIPEIGTWTLSKVLSKEPG